MKMLLWISASCAFALALTSCGNNVGSSSSNPSAMTGPFDSRGNYVEEWADNPSKWRKNGAAPSPHEKKSDELPQIAKNDQPPQNSVPIPPANISKPAPPVISQTQVISKPKPTVTQSTEKIVTTTKRPVEKSHEKSKEKVVAKSKAKAKPKPVVAKTKSKPKPKSMRYVVKKGDSLSTIASRNGSSVSAIKNENGISGAIIRPGQTLIIPKR
jgi:LysM repeat protein